MYDKDKIIPGLIIFVLIVIFPIWYNAVGSGGPAPKPEKPLGLTACVAPAQFMRTSHMQLLNQWRDEVLREGKREKITVAGVEYQKSLQNGCMYCHNSKKKFCDECHRYASVKPYCWDCHIEPEKL